MKKLLAVGVVVAVFLSLQCGKSLNDADRAKASQAVASLFTSGTSGKTLHGGLKSHLARWATGGCKPSTTDLEGISLKVECPTADLKTMKVTITSTVETTKTCGTTTFKIKNISATFTVVANDTTLGLTASMGADVDSKSLSCNFSGSIDSTSSKTSIDDNNYTCTYDGANLSKDDVGKATCSG